MFAVIETGGKQYKVQYGDVIYVEKLDAADNDTVEFPVVAHFETFSQQPFVRNIRLTAPLFYPSSYALIPFRRARTTKVSGPRYPFS